jgi:hypothetical protein
VSREGGPGRSGPAVAASVLATLVAGAGAADIELSNVTAAAGVAVEHGPLPSTYPFGMGWMTGGLGVGDFDRDGLADVFVVGGGGGPDRLFINQGDGTFVDEAAAWGLVDPDCGNGVAVGDVNADGLLDIYVTSFGSPPGPPQPGHNRLYVNQGGWFTDEADALGVRTTCVTTTSAFGAAFGDYDLDGRLDLFVAAWNSTGEGNELFRQLPDGTFANTTRTAIGLVPLGGLRGFQPAFADMDGDLWPELLISADFETSRYLRNNGDGTFTNVTTEAGVGLDDNGMGQTVADFDNDGALDWYVTSIYMDDPPPWHYNGNTLYRADGAHQFQEIAADVGADDGGWGWGTIALDLDQDGWIDIVEVNGREAADGEWEAEPAKLFRNQGGAAFVEMAASAGLDHAASGRCVGWLDVENDGDLDVIVTTNQGPLALYRNDTEGGGGWLQVALGTSTHPGLAPDGFGARVRATAGGVVQTRLINGSPSYLGTSQLIAHFGLGAATVVDELRIEWPRGQVTVLAAVPSNQALLVTAPVPADVTADGTVGIDDLLAVILAWGPCHGVCAADVDADGEVGVDDLLDVIFGWTG